MDDYIKEFFVQVFNGLTPSEQEEFMKHFSAAMGDPYMEELIRFFKQPEMLTQPTKKKKKQLLKLSEEWKSSALNRIKLMTSSKLEK